MKVLHVTLGLPPLRTGGLTRYCVEVMREQVSAGDTVSMMYPGCFRFGKTRLHPSLWQTIRTYEIVNPLPVALTYGVAEPHRFIKQCNNSGVYDDLLLLEHPDIIHVHSFQGIHKEFFLAAKRKCIPLVFTTHDYYPICPRCTFIGLSAAKCTDGPSASGCAKCQESIGMTGARSAVMQSHIYARYKRTYLAKMMGAAVKSNMDLSNQKLTSSSVISPSVVRAYEKLLSYNKDIISLVDLIICNSRLTKKYYETAFPLATCRLLPMTHMGLHHIDKIKNAPSSPIKIGYLGGMKTYKGYQTILEAAALLQQASFDHEFHFFGDDYSPISGRSNFVLHGRFCPEDSQRILSELDIAIVPSIAPETFGFVVLESLCVGTPVICSDVIGSKDMVDEACIFEAGNAESLVSHIIEVVRHRLSTTTSIASEYPLSMGEQVSRLKVLYSEVIGEVNAGRC